MDFTFQVSYIVTQNSCYPYIVRLYDDSPFQHVTKTTCTSAVSTSKTSFQIASEGTMKRPCFCFFLNTSKLQIYRFKRHCLASLNKKKFRLPKQCFKLLKIAQLSVLVFIFFSALPNCQNIVSNYFRKQRIAPLLSKYFQQCQLPNIVSYSVRRHRSATLISKCISSSNYKTSFRIASEGTVQQP